MWPAYESNVLILRTWTTFNVKSNLFETFFVVDLILLIWLVVFRRLQGIHTLREQRCLLIVWSKREVLVRNTSTFKSMHEHLFFFVPVDVLLISAVWNQPLKPIQILATNHWPRNIWLLRYKFIGRLLKVLHYLVIFVVYVRALSGMHFWLAQEIVWWAQVCRLLVRMIPNTLNRGWSQLTILLEIFSPK